MTVKRWLNRELCVKAGLSSIVSTRKGPGNIRAGAVGSRYLAPLDFPVSRPVKKQQVVVRPAQRLARRVPTTSINHVVLDGEAVQVRAGRGVPIKRYRCELVIDVVAIAILGCTPPANDLEGLVPHSRY